MADNSIAPLAIKLTASSAGLDADLKGATKKLEAFGKNATSMFRAPGAIGSALFNPLSGALGSLPFIGGAAAGVLSLDKLKDGFESSTKSIVEMSKEAKKLGFTIEEMSALMTMEGPDFSTESMFTGIRKLQEHLEAAVGDPNSEEGKKFAKFGIDPVKWLDMSTLDRLKAFAGAMKETATASERLSLSKLAGKTGHELVPFLSQGPKAFDEMTEAQEKSLTMTKKMEDNAWAAARAMDNLGDRVTALKNKIAMSVAPTVTEGVTGAEALLGGDISQLLVFAKWFAGFNPGELARKVGGKVRASSESDWIKGLDLQLRKIRGQDIDFESSGGGFGTSRSEEILRQKALDDADKMRNEVWKGVFQNPNAWNIENELGQIRQKKQLALVASVAGKAAGMIGQGFDLPTFNEMGSQGALDVIARHAMGTMGEGDIDWKELVRIEQEQLALTERLVKAAEGEVAMVIP